MVFQRYAISLECLTYWQSDQNRAKNVMLRRDEDGATARKKESNCQTFHMKIQKVESKTEVFLSATGFFFGFVGLQK